MSLVVNVASECAYTHDHYQQMVQIQEELKDKDFTVLAFPCNQFGNQEPHDNVEIEEFVSTNYGLTFPLFGKINVRGHNVHSLYDHIKGNAFFNSINPYIVIYLQTKVVWNQTGTFGNFLWTVMVK